MMNKRINLIEIARLAGTSKSTVSRVLRNQPRVADATRERVWKVIKDHNYQPSLFARGMVGVSTGLIAVIGRWMESGFCAEVVRGVDENVQKRGGHLISSFAAGVDDYIRMWRSLAGGREVDGVVLIAPPVDLFEHQVGLDDKPVVLCACRPEDRRNGWSRVPTVTVDNVTPMKQLVERLVEVDCRRIVLLAGPHDIYDAIQREQTFRESVRQFPNVQGDVWRGACTQETGYSMTAEYLAKHHGPPDAFMAFNDAVAVGVLQCLREHGLRVPDDVRVTGWDDLMFMEFAGLSSVHLPMVEMGNEAARLLYRLIDGEGQPLPPRDKHLVLEQPVVLRGSTE